VILQAIVPLVLPDIKLMKTLDVLPAVLDIIHGHMVPLALFVQVENTQIQPQALVQAAVVAVPLALQLHCVVSVALDMAIHLDYALNVVLAVIQRAELISANLVAQANILPQDLATVSFVTLGVPYVLV